MAGGYCNLAVSPAANRCVHAPRDLYFFASRFAPVNRKTFGRRKKDVGILVSAKTMTRVEQLEQEIAKLSSQEFAQLRDWLLEQDWAEWDREIERDAAAGKLDRLINQALADHAAGKTRPL